MSAKHLCIIPARKGSKSIPHKNLVRIGKKNLVQNIYEKALKSEIFDKIIITTDYTKNELGLGQMPISGHTTAEVIKRPKDLATDDAKMSDVVKHVLKYIGKSHVWVWILQPTCPYSNIEDMKKIQKILDNYDENPDKKIMSVISLRECTEHPNRTYTVKDLGGFPEAFRQRWTNFENKQDLPLKPIRSGNYYAFSREEFEKNGEFYQRCCYAYMVDKETGCNIDSPEDLTIAKWYYTTGKKKI